MQRAFQRHFYISPRGRVLDRKCALMWVDANKETEKVSKKK